jgi:hypothetical protein
MGLLERLLNRLFGCHPGPEVEDPDLGLLRFDGLAWQSQRSDGLLLEIRSGRRGGPDPRQRQALVDALVHLTKYEERAREAFARAPTHNEWWPATWPHPDSAVLTLIQLFTRHGGDDRARQLAAEYPSAAAAVAAGASPVHLIFEVAGDGNVIDVEFIEGMPVEVDYH